MHEGEQTRADAADAMTDDELETAIAALHTRERAFLVAGDVAAATNLMRTKVRAALDSGGATFRRRARRDPLVLLRPQNGTFRHP